jgi:hypothetical protein
LRREARFTRIANHVPQSARRIWALGKFGSWAVQDSALNKIDALLTLTELSSLADKAVLQFGISLVSISNHLPIRPADH